VRDDKFPLNALSWCFIRGTESSWYDTMPNIFCFPIWEQYLSPCIHAHLNYTCNKFHSFLLQLLKHLSDTHVKQQKAIDKCGCYFTQQRPVHSLLYYICINMLSNPSLCLPHCHKIKHKRTYVWLTPLSSSCFDSLIALQRLLSRQCNQN
jgi:hypothetical protein